MNFRKIVESTEAFKNLSKMQKDFTLKRQNVGVLENGIRVSHHLGLEEWERQSNFNHINKPIVQEVHKKKLFKPEDKPVIFEEVTGKELLQKTTDYFVETLHKHRSLSNDIFQPNQV